MSSLLNFFHKLLLLGPGPSSNTQDEQMESSETKDPNESKDPVLPNSCGPNLTFDAVTTFRGEIMFFKDKYVSSLSLLNYAPQHGKITSLRISTFMGRKVREGIRIRDARQNQRRSGEMKRGRSPLKQSVL